MSSSLSCSEATAKENGLLVDGQPATHSSTQDEDVGLNASKVGRRANELAAHLIRIIMRFSACADTHAYAAARKCECEVQGDHQQE